MNSTPSQNFECEECDRVFSKRSHFERHRLTHTQVRDFRCPDCNKQFKRRDHMVRHKNMVHSDEARKFKCPHPDCLSNGFIDNYHLRRHIKAVHEEFTCKICYEKSLTQSTNDGKVLKYRFKKKKQLAKHEMEVHDKPTEFNCKFCNKQFVKKKQYDVHLIRHEDKIQKKNKQILDLSEHDPEEEGKEMDFEDDQLSLHLIPPRSESSPFKIEVKKRFKSSESEENPIVNHYENINIEIKRSENDTLFGDSSIKDFFEKKENELENKQKFSQHQYLCQEIGCFKAFYSEYNLRVHIKTKHLRIREFLCKLCSNEYLHKKNLIEHIKRDHPGCAHSSDSEAGLYRFPDYAISSQKESCKSDKGLIGSVCLSNYKPLSEPKSLCSGSDSAMFNDNYNLDLAS